METKQEDTKTEVSTSDTQTTTEVKTEVEQQDPLKNELEKFQRKGRTKAEKLLYTKKRIDEQLKELGIEEEEPDDEKPMTIGMFKKLQAQTAVKSAIDLAEEVNNPTERELLKYHLENTIRSTGNPQEDFKIAQRLVNASKNEQIVEETLRKPQVNSHASGGGAPPKQPEKETEFTAEELTYMQPPFNLSKEAIIKARGNA